MGFARSSLFVFGHVVSFLSGLEVQASSPVEGILEQLRVVRERAFEVETRESTRKFKVLEGTTDAGVKELRVLEIDDAAWSFGLYRTERLLLVARAILSENYDSWFLVQPFGEVEMFSYHATTENTVALVRNVLQSRFPSESSFVERLTEWKALGSFLFSSQSLRDSLDEIVERQINNLELSLRLAEASQRGFGVPPQMQRLLEEQVLGEWSSIAQALEGLETGVKKAVAADAGAALLGGALIRFGASSALRACGANCSLSKLRGFVQSMRARVSRPRLTGSRVAAAGALQSFYALSSPVRTRLAVAALHAKTQVSQSLAIGGGQFVNVMKAGYQQRGYVSLIPGAQVVSELILNGAEVVRNHPLVTAEKITSDPEFFRNLLFASSQSFLMAGITNGVSGSLKKRLLICAAVAMTNSVAFSFAFEGDPNLERLAVDMGWEAVVSNSATQISLRSIAFFEEMAQAALGVAQAGPLRFAGYAMAFTGETLGLLGYNTVTRSEDIPWEKIFFPGHDQSPDLHWYPVFESISP